MIIRLLVLLLVLCAVPAVAQAQPQPQPQTQRRGPPPEAAEPLREALKLLETIRVSNLEAPWRANAFARIARVLARIGDVQAARTMSNSALQANDEPTKTPPPAAVSPGVIYALLVQTHADLHDVEIAQKLAERGFAVLQTLPDVATRANLLPYMAIGLADIGNRAGAGLAALEGLRAATQVPAGRDQIAALAQVTMAQAKIGDRAEAEETLQIARQAAAQIIDPTGKVYALAHLARAEVAAGNRDRGRTLARESAAAYDRTQTDPNFTIALRVTTLGLIAVAQSEAGDRNTARQTLRALQQTANQLLQTYERFQALVTEVDTVILVDRVPLSVRPARAAAPLLTGAAFLLGPVGFLAPLGLAPLLIAVALGLATIAVLERRFPAPPVDFLAAFGLLCTLALASVLWAIEPWQSFVRALRLVGECAEGFLLIDAAGRLDAAERRRVLAGLALGLGLMIVLAVTDALLTQRMMRWLRGTITPATVGNRGATVLALMMWPTVLFLARMRGRLGGWLGSRGAAIGGWILATIGIVACLSASAHLALVVATITFLVALRWRQAVARVALVLVPALVLLMPMVPVLMPPDAPLLPRALLKPSAIHRLVIWHFADTRIAERPLLGWGLDAARAMPGGKNFTVVVDPDGQPQRYEQMPLHPHNGALQVWLELGAVGALVGALIALVVLSRLTPDRLAPAERAVGLATFATAAVELSLSYGIWQSWWIAALWFAAFAVAITVEDRPV